MTGASPLAVAAARLVIAATLLLIAALLRPTKTAPTGRERTILAVAGLALAAHFATWIGSLDETSVAVSTLLVSTTPLWTAAYDALVRRITLPRAALVAFVVGAIGLVAIVRYDTTPAPHPNAQLLGDALALGGALAFAVYLLVVRTVRDRLDTRTIVTHTYSWAAAALLIATLIGRQPFPAWHASAAWGGILAMAFVSQLLGHTAINASLRWFTPSTVAFSTLLEPVIAAVLAFLVFGEGIAPLAIGGAALILAAIGLVTWTDPMRELDSSTSKGLDREGE